MHEQDSEHTHRPLTPPPAEPESLERATSWQRFPAVKPRPGRSDKREDALMASYASGDDRALLALFNLTAPRLLAFLRCGQIAPCSPEELLEATFVQVRRARGSYRPGTPLRPWLFGLTARVQLDVTRRKERALRAAARQSTQPSAAALPELPEPAERNSGVQRALEALSIPERQVVHLHRFEGLSFSEIARALGASETVVRAQAFRGYQQLRERLWPLLDARGRP